MNEDKFKEGVIDLWYFDSVAHAMICGGSLEGEIYERDKRIGTLCAEVKRLQNTTNFATKNWASLREQLQQKGEEISRLQKTLEDIDYRYGAIEDIGQIVEKALSSSEEK